MVGRGRYWTGLRLNNTCKIEGHFLAHRAVGGDNFLTMMLPPLHGPRPVKDLEITTKCVGKLSALSDLDPDAGYPYRKDMVTW